MMSGLVPIDFLHVVIGHVSCILMGNILSNILKLQIGRPRPDFFDVLGNSAGSQTLMPEDMTRKTYIECFNSFPSGDPVTASSGTMYRVVQK
jgi:membrane-associated phospholipid phosphatase